jgi:hypothetical protein
MLLEPEGDKQVRQPDFLAMHLSHFVLMRQGGVNATEAGSVHTLLPESKLGFVE